MPPASSSGPRSCWRLRPGYRTRLSRPPSRRAARQSIAPSVASWKATSRRRLTRSPGPAQCASSPAQKRLCWSPPPAPARPWGVPAGPSSSWPGRWCSSPSTRASRARRCAGVWPRMRSSRGSRRCGASRRSTASTWRAWRMCLISMPKSLIRSTRWCALTRARTSSSARRAPRSRPHRGRSHGSIMSIAAAAR